MIEVIEVKSRRQRREFIEFPVKLYKGNPCFAPSLYLDEVKIFKKNYMYYETCEAICFNAYKDGVMAGRIQGILQRAHNEKTGGKRIRFTRFDVINDFEVAKALFDKLEEWGRSLGMDTVNGPMGFSDFEKEGMLIEGFDQMSTFEEQYNAPWYPEFMERLGYEKEVDWLEYQITLPEEDDHELEKMSDFIMRRYNLKFGKATSGRDFCAKYAKGFFNLIDESYKDIYGTVPFTEGQTKLMIENFRLIIDNRFAAVILDETGKVICLGLAFPNIAKALTKSGGHLNPVSIVKVLKSVRHPEVLDLGLIGVDPVWMNRGIACCVAAELKRLLREFKLDHLETNLNLEDNYAIINMWKRFGHKQNKRRRAYIKKIA